MNYYDIYKKRLNRFGRNQQERIQGQRERDFNNLCDKSVYRTSFIFGENEDGSNKINVGIFKPLKQNNTETIQNLLTNINLDLPNGTILLLTKNNKKDKREPWMVYWKENILASGYNKYIMLKLTHEIKWIDRNNQSRSTWAYFYGQEDNMLKDELKSRSRSDVLYNENLKLSFFVTPTNEFIKKNDYFVLGEDSLEQGYVVTGYDYVSTPGVEFVSVDPVYLYDMTAPPEKKPEESADDYFWLDGE